MGKRPKVAPDAASPDLLVPVALRGRALAGRGAVRAEVGREFGRLDGAAGRGTSPGADCASLLVAAAGPAIASCAAHCVAS